MKPAARCCLLAGWCSCLAAADWPRFLGPEGTGVSDETGWNQRWTEKEPRMLWTADVGIGCASIAIANGLACTVGHPRRSDDTIWCFDAITGAVKWKFEYKHELEPKYYSGGPSATPAIDGGKLYAVSKDGDLRCLDAETGALLWQKSYAKDFGGEEPKWGYAASPFVIGDLLICEPGGRKASLVALNKETGAEMWRAGSDPAAYATPTLFEKSNGPAIACFNRNGLVGYDLQGRELLRAEWRTQNDVNATGPLHADGGILISSSYGNGAAFLSVEGGRAKQLWKEPVLSLQFQNMLPHDGHVFAVNGDNTTRASFRCIDLRTGKMTYEEKLSGNRGSVLRVGDKLLILTETGELVLAAPSTERFTEYYRIQVNKKTCWAPPAFANGLFYCRNNDGKLVCVDMQR